MTDRRANATPAKLDAILRTIQNLMARIEDPRLEDGPEKDRMREHAERLMREYRVEESELIASDTAAGRAPVSVPGARMFPIAAQESEYWGTYLTMAYAVAAHCEVRITAGWKHTGRESVTLFATVVGYEGDTRYAEALFTEARTYFANRMEPGVDSRLSDAENVYRLRSAGIERGRIGQMMGWGDKAHIRVTNVYKKECERRGEEPTMSGRGNSMKVFREAFCLSFPNTLAARLYRARQAVDGGSGAVVLAGRKDAVNEEFYRLFPHQRPTEVARNEKAPARRKATWTKADQAAWDRMNSESAQLGREAGERAAKEVNVKTAQGTNRLDG